MPICVNCSSSVPVLYTQYESAYNLRLEQCVCFYWLSIQELLPLVPDFQPLKSACHAFADPYVEHDTLNLVIDLILLKKAVFIHLIYNKDSEPRRAVSNKAEPAVPAPSRSVREREEAEVRDIYSLRFAQVLRERVSQEWYRYQTTAELGIGLVLLDARTCGAEYVASCFEHARLANMLLGLSVIRCSSAGLFSSDASSGSCAQQFAIMLFRCAGGKHMD